MIRSLNQIIIFILFFFSYLQAENFNFKNDDLAIILSFQNEKLNLIEFEYILDKDNDIKGSLEITNKLAVFKLESNFLDYKLLSKMLPKNKKNMNKKINIKWIINNLKVSKNLTLN